MNRHALTRGLLGGGLLVGLWLGVMTACRPGAAFAWNVPDPPPGAGSDATGSAGARRPFENQANAGPPDEGGEWSAPESAREQLPRPNQSIFQRFVSGRDVSKTWQTMFEVPAGLYPQTDPNARVVANEGLNWVTFYEPLNRIFFGRSIGYEHMEWRPGGRLDTTEVVQWDWTEILGFALQPWWVMTLGAGVGFMDGLIFYKSGAFQHRLEVFLPLQIGTGVRLGKTWFLGVKVAQSSYFGPGPVASVTRALVGIGYNY